jgi:hypothetical protein
MSWEASLRSCWISSMPIDRRRLPVYIQVHQGEWIVIAEKRRSARFRNPDSGEVLVVHVDGGLISEGERADYIVAHPKIVDVIVELKGGDVSKAVQQIRTTHPVWARCEWAGQKHAALVVRGKGIHPKLLSRFERWQREFRKTLQLKLLIQTRNRDYEFSEFLLPAERHTHS